MLEISLNNNTIDIKVFAYLILKGKASLYKGIYKSNVFYVISKDTTNYVLQNDVFIPGHTEVKRYNYKGILNLATENLPIKSNSDIGFRENDFIEIITKYNLSKGSEIKDFRQKEKATKFLIAYAGGGVGKDDSEYFFQLIHRLYYPRISKSTSLNIGVNYYNYQVNDLNNASKISLISLPFQIQHNLSNKSFRPYLFTGINFSYLRKVDDDNNSLLEDGFQSNYGFGFLYGAGIEIDIYKGLMLKSEFRYETFAQLILFGIGYNFSK